MYLNTVRQIILEGEVADEKCPSGAEKGGGSRLDEIPHLPMLEEDKITW